MRNIRKRDLRLENSAGYALGRAFRRLNRAVSGALRPLGLSGVQGNVLITLWERGRMPVGELQKTTGLSSSAFTGALDRMEAAKLVRRVPAPSDRRSFLVEPARWSSDRKLDVIEALLEAEREFLGSLDRSERAQLLRLLTKVAEGS